MAEHRDEFSAILVRILINLSALVVTGALIALVVATIIHEAG